MLIQSTRPPRETGSGPIYGARIPSTPLPAAARSRPVQILPFGNAAAASDSQRVTSRQELAFTGFHRVHSHVRCAWESFETFTIMRINCDANTDGKRWLHAVIGNAFTDSLRRVVGRLCACFR